MENIQQNIRQRGNVKVIYQKNTKTNIKASLMRKSIISLSFLAFIITFSFIFFFSKKIGTHWQKYPKRKLNPNNNKDTIISHKPNIFINQRFGPAKSIFYNPSIGEPCECEVGDEYQDNQGIHRSLKCKCEEDYSNYSFSNFENIECFFTDSKNCNCTFSEISGNNISFDCLYNLTYNSSTFNCSGYYFFKEECDPYLTNNEENNEYINHILDQIEKGYFEEIFTKAVKENETYIQEENNITYQISTVSSQYSTNYSTVGLEECESILKDVYSLDKNESLVLLKLEHQLENSKIPIIEYQLFTKDGKQLNLSFCNKTEQIVSIPVTINEDEEYLHNPNSDFYQDKCHVYTTEYDTDLSGYDRKNNYNEKLLALCEKDCTYIAYNNTSKRVNCECKTKTTFPDSKLSKEEINVKELLNEFIDFKKIFFNIYVITCYKQLFRSSGFKKNLGSYINIVFVVVGCLFTILFCITGFNSFISKMNKIIGEKELNNEKKQNDATVTYLKTIPDLTLSEVNLQKNNVNTTATNIKTIPDLPLSEANLQKNNVDTNATNLKTNPVLPLSKVNLQINNFNTNVSNLKTNPVLPLSEANVQKSNVNISFESSLNLPKNNSNSNSNSRRRNLYDDYNDYEINKLEYKEAKEKDLSFFEIYRSKAKASSIVIFTFWVNDDYNPREIKICLFLFWLALEFASNAIFFNDFNLHKIYEDKGKYNFIYQLPFTIYSLLISYFITELLNKFALIEDDIDERINPKVSKTKENKNERGNKETELKTPEKEKEIKTMNSRKIDKDEINKYLHSIKWKFIIFFSLMILLLLFFWYYLSSFCAIFQNTQVPLLKDTLISYGISLLYPFIIVIIPCSIRYCALKAQNQERLYNVSDKMGDFLLLLH